MRPRILLTFAVLALSALGACRPPLASKILMAGVSAAREDRWEEAVRYWKKVLERDPDSAAARNNLAVAYEKQGAFEEARKEYDEALRLDPDNLTIKDNFERFKSRQEAARTGKGPAARGGKLVDPAPGRGR